MKSRARFAERARRGGGLGLALWLGCAPLLAAATDVEVSITPDVVYGHKDGMALVYDLLTPPAPNGALIACIASGGWFSTWKPPEERAVDLRALLERGFSLAVVYHSSAPRYTVPAALDDVRRAVRHLRSQAAARGFAANRIGAFGSSAGGQLSLMLGLVHDAGDPASDDPVLRESDAVQAVVAYFAPSDMRPLVGRVSRSPALRFPAEQAALLSPIDHVSSGAAPILLVHGDADLMVPLSDSQRLYAALQAAQVPSKLLILAGAGHGLSGPGYRAEATAALLDWFEQHLQP